MQHSKKGIDLTGQRFGRLTALERADNIGGRTAWRCRCDCGRETVAKTYHLRGGQATSCGCARANHLALSHTGGTCVEPLKAQMVRRNNTSGVPGVDWRASKGLWRAAICFKGKRYYLGSYAEFEDAVKARRQAEERLRRSSLQDFAESAAAENGGEP